jgi:hypothetical protein
MSWVIDEKIDEKIEARTIPNFDFLLCSYSLIKGPVYTCETITLTSGKRSIRNVRSTYKQPKH